MRLREAETPRHTAQSPALCEDALSQRKASTHMDDMDHAQRGDDMLQDLALVAKASYFEVESGT